MFQLGRGFRTCLSFNPDWKASRKESMILVVRLEIFKEGNLSLRPN